MGRYLKRNHGTEAPSNLIFFDTESYQEVTEGKVKTTVHKLRLWCAVKLRLENGEVTRRKEATGTDPESFWQFVGDNSDSEKCTWIFAHNLAFDLTLIHFWRKLDEGWFTLAPMKSKSLGTDGQSKNSWLGKLCVEQTPFWIQCRRGKKTYKLVDTVNYWQMPLAKLAECYGLSKMKLPANDASKETWDAYCWNDVTIIERAVTCLIQKWRAEDCGVFQPTAASLAMTNFRHTCPIRTPDGQSVDIVFHSSSVPHALERESYFGGRIQAFFVGERNHKIYHLDCNSLYPAVMNTFSYPRRLVETHNGIGIEQLRSLSKVYGVCARVHINSRFETFPVRVDGKQYHCCGRYWTTLCGGELERAIETNCIDRIGKVQVYSVAPIFRDWVCKWYASKLKAEGMGSGGTADRQFAKLLLNSLSGKWAQHGRHWKDLPGQIPIVRWGGYVSQQNSKDSYQRFRGIAGHCQVLTEGKEPDHAFPAISAFITANAREYMRRAIGLCPEGSVYYMATDSLVCGEDAYESLRAAGLIDMEKLGCFKIVGIHKYCCIHGPNDYVLDAKQVISGHMGKAKIDPSGLYKCELWEKAPSLISSGPRDSVSVKEVPVFYPSHTNRGRIREDGYWEPYRITDDLQFTDRIRQGGYFAGDLQDTEAAHIPPDA